MMGPRRSSIQLRTRMRCPLSCLGSTPAAAKLPRGIMTEKSLLQCRPKFKYIVLPVACTDKTSPRPNANRPRLARSCASSSAAKGAIWGFAQSPRRPVQAAVSSFSRASAHHLSPTRAKTRASPASRSACCTEICSLPAKAKQPTGRSRLGQVLPFAVAASCRRPAVAKPTGRHREPRLPSTARRGRR